MRPRVLFQNSFTVQTCRAPCAGARVTKRLLTRRRCLLERGPASSASLSRIATGPRDDWFREQSSRRSTGEVREWATWQRAHVRRPCTGTSARGAALPRASAVCCARGGRWGRPSIRHQTRPRTVCWYDPFLLAFGAAGAAATRRCCTERLLRNNCHLSTSMRYRAAAEYRGTLTRCSRSSTARAARERPH